MTGWSKSQYGGRPSLKSRGNQENRCSTGRSYEKICQKELTPIVVEEEEFSPPMDDAEPENACHNLHSDSPPARCLV